MRDIEVKCINDFCDVTSSKRVFKADYLPEGVPFYRAKEISEKHNGKELTDRLFISKEKFETFRKKFGVPRDGDLLLTSIGALLGEPYVVHNDGDFYFKDGNLTWFRNFRGLNSKYLYYWLISPQGKAQLSTAVIGSAQPAFTIVALKAMSIGVPRVSYQSKVVAILSAYDDLIQNNTRRIAILEEMAQAIYREWFVNFRFPGHENVKLVQSTLGMIPEGWECVTLESVLSFYIGGGWGKEVEEEGFTKKGAVIRGTDINDAKHLNIATCPTRFHSDSNIGSRRLQNADIVFEVSGGSKGQPVGRSLFVSDRLLACFEDDVICASFCKLIRPNESKLCSLLVYHFLRECYTNGIVERYEVQSTGIKNFKFTEFIERELIIVPTRDKQQLFQTHIQSLQSEIEILGKKNSNLRTTRDLLLPKLISGQLDVEELDIDLGITAEVTGEPTAKPIERKPAVRATANDDGASTSSSTNIPEPIPIDELDVDQVMAEFRQQARRLGTTTRGELLKAVSQELGYKRLGHNIEEVLKGHLRAAIRRKIIAAEGELVCLHTPSMDTYERNELIDAFHSVMRKSVSYEREDVIRALANHLGFRRLTDTVREPIKSAINAAIRRGVLDYKGELIWRAF